MALKSTIFKTSLSIADMDRHHYHDYALTIARHPSETDERMMVRILAFALHADSELSFTKGLSTDDEPDLWLKNSAGEIELWIETGHPDERRIRKACGRAKQVIIYCYGGRSATIWWEQNKEKLQRNTNLSIYSLPTAAVQSLAKLAQRNMQLQCTIQEEQAWLSDDRMSVQIEPLAWMSPH